MKNRVIEVLSAVKRYGPIIAVDGVNLEVSQGEIFGLIGHNGAGKSTLFKMMLGLLPMSGGAINICGQSIADKGFRELRSSIGYLPENVVFYDNLTGIETLRYYADLKGVDKRTCGMMLEKVGLSHAGDRRVSGYSKGMRQRLGFAQAMLGAPVILFLDEPTSGLDPEGIREFYQILREMRDQGVTIILTSHILAEIQERVDRIAIMKLGKIQAAGTVQQLRDGMDLPLSVQIRARDIAHKNIAAAVSGIGLALTNVDNETATIVCPRERKMSLVAVLGSLQDQVMDIHIQEPSLEDVFLGCSG